MWMTINVRSLGCWLRHYLYSVSDLSSDEIFFSEADLFGEKTPKH